jgi:hypothetical protein
MGWMCILKDGMDGWMDSEEEGEAGGQGKG